jgi:protein-L-isoaspartate(D-aspartate) O-methyltransferase
MDARVAMVHRQIEARGVSNPAVLDAMRKVPRHEFVPREFLVDAYDDSPLPVGNGQTISQPYIVALMTEMLQPESSDKILEIGTGSGYQAAVLAEIVSKVYTVEIIESLHVQAEQRLKDAGYKNVFCKCGDGSEGWLEHAPYDGIIVTAAAPGIPPGLITQLKDGAKMVIPVGAVNAVQTLYTLTRNGDDVSVEPGIAVRFVPLTGCL